MSHPPAPDLPALLAQAADGGGGSAPARAAQERLHAWRMADATALGCILAALTVAPREILEAAGDWLFQAEPDWPLGLELAGAAGALLDLAQARPGPWWREGLAGVLALAGGRPLARLMDLAQSEEWARQVLAGLPPELRLPGGAPPGVWLARQDLGQTGVRRLRRQVARSDWSVLAGQGDAALTLAQHLAGCSQAAAAVEHLAWPGGDLTLLEEMAALTAREGQAAYELASLASRASGRLVILLGNASLGGPPLWAVPGPWQQSLAWAAPAPTPTREVAALARLRAQRLAGPGLVQDLWHLRASVALHGRGHAVWRDLLAQAAPWLSPQQAQGLADASLPLALEGRPPVQARVAARAAIERAGALERQGRAALALVRGLAAGLGRSAPGQALVIPWADKFAASTAKGGDHAYLAGLVRQLAEIEPAPLLLLIDETSHPASASLGRILQEAAPLCPGLALRGLGAFAGQTEPSDLADEMLAALPGASLVALRPRPQAGSWAGLEERLAGRGQGLPLSPVSRDGAAWLLAGTRLAELTLAPPAAGRPAPWLLTSAGFAHLGAWFRRRVMALAGCSEPPAGPWRGCQHLCNLI